MKRILAMALSMTLLLGTGASGESTEEIAMRLFEYINNRDYDAAHAMLDASVSSMMTAKQLGEAWESVMSVFGSVNEYEIEQIDGLNAALLCRHKGGNTRFTCTFNEAGKVLTFRIVPVYDVGSPLYLELPEGATEKNIKLTLSKGVQLNAQFLLPVNYNSDTPAVVFVQGSGPSDMDETVGPYKPFRDMAYALCEAGMASIRYDKVSYSHPGLFVDLENMTIDFEVVSPALKALEAVKAEGFENIYLLGHSLGGMTAPYIMSQSQNGFKGGIIMAGSPRKLWEIMYDQNIAILTAQGGVGDDVKAGLDAQTEKAREVLAMTREQAKGMTDTILGMPAYYLWSLDRHDAAALALENGLPLLILQGEADFQISLNADFQAWKSALGENDDLFTFISYPGLNHLFMPAREGYGIDRAGEAYTVPSIVDKNVTDDICEWINAAQVGK
ncbi:MAG: hypothetical protein Q4D04_10045 [Clostridia bacterium]|nr:hypothetical protein [Clostridia bacterium]